MAFYNQNQNQTSGQGMNSLEDEEKKKQQQAAAGGAVQLTGASANGANAAPAATQAPKPASSGMGPGFQNFAKANQGTATNRLANAAQSNVQNVGQQAQTSIQQATNAFGKRVDAGSLANRYQAVSDVANAVNSARNIQAQPQAQAPAAGANAAAPAAQPNALGGMDQSQVNRFKDVINAKYQGPESLRQSGLYNPAAQKVDAANQAVKNSGTAQGREELLRDMYAKRGDYTRGLNKLDTSLLNSSKEGVQNLQNTAGQFKNVSNDLTKAQINSVNSAQNRTNEIKDIRNQARDTFSQGKTAEEKATEDRLDSMLVTPVKDENGNVMTKPDGTPMTQWDQLPEYFKNVIRNKKTNNQASLDQQTAQIKADGGYDALNSQFTALQNQRKAAENELKKAQFAVRNPNGLQLDGVNNLGSVSPEQIAKNQARLQAAQSAFDSINSQFNDVNTRKSALDSQLSGLRDNFNPNALNLNSFEAGVLGVESGEGLYNLGENAIRQGVAERDRLVSRDEQARQAALAALAGLDQSNQLDTNLRYSDAAKAGTQSIQDSLDLDGTRRAIDEAEQNFRNTADATNIVGEGKKKVSRGNAFGKKTQTYRATQEGNVKDMLSSAGYDFDAEGGQSANLDNQKQLLNAALQASKKDNNSGDVQRDDAKGYVAGTAKGAAAGASLGSMGGPGIGTAIGAGIGAMAGGALQSGTVDRVQQMIDLANGFAPGVGRAAQDIRNTAGEASKDLIRTNPLTAAYNEIGKMVGLGDMSKHIAGAVGGIDTNAMKSFGSAKAKENARQDLQRQYGDFLDSQGFQNRVAVNDTGQTKSRLSGLQQLLANLDKTNS